MAGPELSLTDSVTSEDSRPDKDILNLTHISKDSVDFSLNSGTLTIAADFGGTIDVLGWDVNPLSKIVFGGNTVVYGSDIS